MTAPPPAPASEAEPPAPTPATRSRASLPSRGGWLLLALLAAAAAIAAALSWNRHRQIARTRAAISLDPRLDLGDGSGSLGSPAMACPAVSIRARLELANG